MAAFSLPQGEVKESPHAKFMKPQKVGKKPIHKKVAKSANPSRSYGFPCPYCSHPRTYVLKQSGNVDPLNYYYRRRRICFKCAEAPNAKPQDGRFTTRELIVVQSELIVVKSDGTREPWDRKKLKRSIEAAFAKRHITPERLQRILFGIEDILDRRNDEKDNIQAAKGMYIAVPSKRIGAMVLNSLKELDQVAYLRYASIFFRFQSTDDYQTLIDGLL